ncbi:MAG: hypothetical protein BWZ10_01440 [candidate division BRC1 bacterium ADurb.BinA364]|nr:MAG: hypothetical protein BWZ10_01440 [candidate division BRC1 bacterium ADurb.BinA364]
MIVRVWNAGSLMEPAEQPQWKLASFPPQRQPLVPVTARLAAPRLAADSDGRVWLAARRGEGGSRPAIGTVWTERLAFYDGAKWSDGIFCPLTDGLLDNQPALLAAPQGGMAMIAASDRRYEIANEIPIGVAREIAKEMGSEPPLPAAGGARADSLWPDPVNSELTLAALSAESLAAPEGPALSPVAETAPAEPSEDVAPEAEMIARMREHRTEVAGQPLRILRGEFHRHTELSGDGGGDGMLMDMWRYAHDAANMDWIGNGDHDNGNGREYSWWITQKTTSMFRLPGVFEPMFTYERSCTYPDGHRNVVFARRGVRPLPRLAGGKGEDLDDELQPEDVRPNSPDTLMLYKYLAEMDGVCASHTSGTDMGTDWRDNDPKVEPVVEIYQGDRQNYEMPGAPRSNTAEDSVGGWRPLGFVSLALQKGYRLGFQSSSDHASTHMSYCNVWVEEPSREAILDALKRRRVYGSTDNIIGEFFCGEHFMGEEFSLSEPPVFRVRIIGSQPIKTVHIVKDGKYVYSPEFSEREVSFEWTDMQAEPGKTSYYYVRGEQSDGELVWLSPMWIAYRPK